MIACNRLVDIPNFFAYIVLVEARKESITKQHSTAYHIWFALAPFFMGFIIWGPIVAYFQLHWGAAVVILVHLVIWASVLEWMEDR